MIIPIFFYAKCDPTFQQKVLDPLEKEIADIQTGDEFSVEKSDLIKASICKYAYWNVIPHEYWETCLEYLRKGTDYSAISKVEEKAAHHFIVKGIYDGQDKDHPAYYLVNNAIRVFFDGDPDESVLHFPHDDLRRMFLDYTKDVLTQHPSTVLVNKYKEMTKLYSEIKAAEDDTEKWYNLLLGVNIDKFLRTNVEYRLRGNLLDKQLWKLYIDYLKRVDPIALLVVYSKYVRFFMDDKEMLEEYKQQMEEHGHVCLFWKNLLEFEKQSHMLESDEIGDEDMMNSAGEEESDSMDEEMNSSGDEESDISDDDMNSTGEEESDNMDEEMISSSEDDLDKMDLTVARTPFNRQICATFFNNINPQKELSFLNPTIVYLLKHAPSATLQKLFKSGKYFFARKPNPICYRLSAYEDGPTEFYDESVSLNIVDDEDIFYNFILSTTVKVEYYDDEGNINEGFKKYTSNLIPHLYRCDAKFIELDNQILSFKDLKFLIGGGNCIELELPDCEIKDENGEYIDLERIMEFLPKIENLELPTVKVNSNTAHALSAQKFEGELCHIVIQNIIGKPFDAEEFRKFIDTTRAKFIYVYLYFDKTFDAGFVATLKQVMDEYKFPEMREGDTYFTVKIN